jgi:hypothetical protein
MKNIFKILFVIVVTISLPFISNGQEDFISRLKTQLLLYRTQKADQIVVVQTDKSLYRQGETIWMKGYVTDAITHSLALNSRELSVQLTDDKGSSVKEGKFLLQNGMADFNFVIPSDLPSDLYCLVACTPEMENAGIQDVFRKELIIARPENLDVVPYLEFSKPYFAPDCKESAILSVTNLAGKPISGKRFEYQVISADKELLSGKGKTGTNGAGEVVFFTPSSQKGEALLASLTIPSGRDRLNMVSQIPLSSEKINVNFFPEGGKVVPGIPQLIIYEAKDQLGNLVNLKSDIIDQQGNLVVSTETARPGLGAFHLLNTDNQKLKMRIVSDIGKNQEILLPLPSPGSMGIAIKKNDGKNLSLLVARPPKSESEHFRIVAVCNGELTWASEFELGDSGVINVPLDNFNSEIAGFAVFNQRGALMAQRLVYTKKNKFCNITFTPDKSVYGKGEEGIISVKVTDRDGKGVKAELAVGIADKFTFPASSSQVGSLTYGFRKPPLFDVPLEMADGILLDYFLISNSLRGFDWEKVMAINPSGGANGRINAIRISGTVLDEKDLPVPNALVSLTSTSLQQFMASSDMKGEFVINLPVSVEKRNLSASATDGSGRGNYRVILNKSFKDELVNSLNHLHVNNWQMLERICKSDYFRDNPDFFKARPAVKVRSEERKGGEPYWKKYLTGSSNLLDVIKSIRPFEMTGGKIVFRGMNSFIAQDGALIVIDGQRMGSDAAALNMINPQDVDDIRILLDPVEMGVYSGLNSIGVIEIKTKHGGDEGSKTAEMKTPEKESAPKQFVPEPIGDSKYDLKTTLQWIPVLYTNEKGEAIIPFRAGGIKSSFVIEVAGFTDTRQWIGSQADLKVE